MTQTFITSQEIRKGAHIVEKEKKISERRDGRWAAGKDG